MTETTGQDAAMAVTTADPTAVALVRQQASASKMRAAKPTDDFAAKDLMIPWLNMVQSSSGYVKKGKATYNPEAREGDIVDNLTHKLRAYQAIILVKYETHYTTFKPNGGALVKNWFTDTTGYDAANYPQGKDYGDKLDAEGNDVKQIPMYYILMVDLKTGAADPAMMAWGSTQAKKVRAVNSLARADLIDPTDGMPFVPPIYARIFGVTTRIETGGEGGDKSWSGWVAVPEGVVLDNEKFGDMWFAKAQAFREQIEKGNVRPMPPENDAASTSDRDDEPRGPAIEGEVITGGSGAALADDVPF